MSWSLNARTAMDTLITLVYLVLLLSLMVYWPLQLVAALTTRGTERMVVLVILAAGLLAMALIGDPGPDAPNFPPWSWVVSAFLADATLIAMMVRSIAGRFLRPAPPSR
jgi:hypothetical protein